MEDAEPLVAFGQRLEQPIRGGVVAADEPYDFALAEPMAGLCGDVGVHGCAALVDAADLAGDAVVVGRTALFQVADDLFGVAAQALRCLLEGVVDVGCGDAAAPCVGRQRVVEVELRRGFDDGIGAVGRAGAIGDCDVPRCRDEHQLRIVRGERHPEIGAVVHAHAVRIERLCIRSFRHRIKY